MLEIDELKRDLAPDIDVVRPVGQGSVASVFLGRESALHRLVAVKVLRPELSHASVARQRFEREAQAAASIKHPNVTAIYRVGRLPSDVPFIVMEYVEGRTLADVLRARDRLSIEETRRVVAAIASALAAAHRRNIVHRDLRPENVLWENETDRVVLVDFGLAALLAQEAPGATRLTSAGQTLGDPLHISPEQLRGDRVTAESDVFGLGIIAFEILTGRPPWPALTARDRPPPHVQTLRPDVPDDLAALITHCLADEPRHRPRASDIFEALVREPRVAQRGWIDEFLDELKRRKVYKAALAYVAAAYIGLQGVDIWLLPMFRLPDPDATYRMIARIGAAGFPIVVVLSWLFDVTSRGVQRTSDPGTTRRGWIPAAGLILALALTVGVWWLFNR